MIKRFTAGADDEKLVEEAVMLLLKEQLSWSGSYEGLPSDHAAEVRSAFMDTYMEGHYTDEDVNAMNNAEFCFAYDEGKLLFKDAKIKADEKWVAAMTLLGF